jgi:hypothetical protein
MASAQDEEEAPSTDARSAEPRDRRDFWDIDPPREKPEPGRSFGTERIWLNDEDEEDRYEFGNRTCKQPCGGGYMYRVWPSQLIRRPMSPFAGMLESRLVGEAELGAGHAGSPLRLAASFAYGLGDYRFAWDVRRWGIALETGRGVCIRGEDGRCERRFDQVSADGIYVIVSITRFEWLVKAGAATTESTPSARAASAAKILFDWCAVELDLLAQVPVRHFDTTPTVIVAPAQLQIRLQSYLAAYLMTGFRGEILSGQRDLTMPAAVGLLLGSRKFDVGMEWRYPRVRGTGQTWSERSLFMVLAFRYW